MKYRITFSIKNPEETNGHLHVEAKHEYIDERSLIFLEEIFLTLLRSCKIADKKAFYSAMARFAAEDFDDARQFIKEELDNED